MQEYLGDGLFASFDGYAIQLRAPREGGDHWVELERPALKQLIVYAIRVGMLREVPMANPAMRKTVD